MYQHYGFYLLLGLFSTGCILAAIGWSSWHWHRCATVHDKTAPAKPLESNDAQQRS